MKISALIASVLLLTTFAASQNNQLDARTSIEKVLNAQVAAWNGHDLEKFMQGYWHSPELTFFSGGQVSHGWDQALDRYRKRYQGEGHEMGKLSFANLDVKSLSPTSALARGEFHLTMPDGKTPHGLFTLIFQKFPDGWKIIHDHSSAAE